MRRCGSFPHLFTMRPDLDDGQELSRRGPDRPADGLLARADPAEKRHPAEKDVAEILSDGSYLAEVSGNGVTVTVRVIEYFVNVEGQEVPEMFCLVTDLMDSEEYPAAELAALYKWRWDGSETALREAKAEPARGRAVRPGRCSAPAARGWSGRSSPPGPPRREDPRRRPRRRARRRPRPEGTPRRAARPGPARSPMAAPAAP